MRLKVLIGFSAIIMLSFLAVNTSWSQVEGIDGTWYAGQKAMTVKTYDSGWRLSVTDENGNKSHGKAFNEDVIYLTEENISGQIELDATIIHWSDGTYWSRQAFTGETPPNLPEDDPY